MTHTRGHRMHDRDVVRLAACASLRALLFSNEWREDGSARHRCRV